MCKLHSITPPVTDMRRFFDVFANNDQLGSFISLEAVFPKRQCPLLEKVTGAKIFFRWIRWNGVLLGEKHQKNTGKTIATLNGTTCAMKIFLNLGYGQAALKRAVVS